MGWSQIRDKEIGQHIHPDTKPDWVDHWHRFIDHLAENGTADEFFEDLLTKAKER